MRRVNHQLSMSDLAGQSILRLAGQVSVDALFSKRLDQILTVEPTSGWTHKTRVEYQVVITEKRGALTGPVKAEFFTTDELHRAIEVYNLVDPSSYKEGGYRLFCPGL